MKILTALLFMILLNSAVQAQPFNLDKTIKPAELMLIDYVSKTNPKWNGKMAMSDVTQRNENSYFYVRGMSIYQPVYFTIVAENPADKLSVELTKNNWKTPDKSGVTDQKGIWKMTFKTEGSFGIKVKKTSAASKYRLMVWVGKEPENSGLTSPFK